MSSSHNSKFSVAQNNTANLGFFPLFRSYKIAEYNWLFWWKNLGFWGYNNNNSLTDFISFIISYSFRGNNHRFPQSSAMFSFHFWISWPVLELYNTECVVDGLHRWEALLGNTIVKENCGLNIAQSVGDERICSNETLPREVVQLYV